MSKQAKAAENKDLSQFEDKLAELEKLVSAMESGEIKLEESVKSYERGMALSQDCENLLKQAELRVQQLSKNDDGSENLEEFVVEP